MGYDVTFHPASVAELQRHFFDVLDDPKLAKERASIARTPSKRRDLLEGVYARLPELARDTASGEADFENTIAFGAAAVAGYLHPYWYARGSALCFLLGEGLAKAKEIPFVRLGKLFKGKAAKLPDSSEGQLTANYTGSGLILPEQVAGVEALVERLAKPAGKKGAPIFEVFDEENLDALRRALAYARKHGLGLMEATDLVVPISGESYTDSDNLRASWLKNVAYDRPGKPPKRAKRKPAKRKSKPGRSARSSGLS